MKLIEIIPGLFIRGDLTRVCRVAQELADRKIDVVVSLIKPKIQSIENHTDILSYIYMPIPDGKVPDELAKKLAMLTDYLVMHLRAGRNVSVNCQQGRNRASLVAALVVRLMEGVSGSEAIERVRAKRPNALANPHFVKFLEELPNVD